MTLLMFSLFNKTYLSEFGQAGITVPNSMKGMRLLP